MIVASHWFIKAHRHLPGEDSLARRCADAGYVLVYGASNWLWDHWLFRRN